MLYNHNQFYYFSSSVITDFKINDYVKEKNIKNSALQSNSD